MNRKRRSHKLLWIGGSVGVLLALVVAVVAVAGATLVGGNVAQARRIAARLQADAIANPDPVGTGASSAAASAGVVTPLSTTASRAPTSTTGATHAAAHPAATPNTSGAPTQAAAAGAGSAVRSPSVATAPKVASPAKSSTVAPMRQPTSAEVAEAISAVHSLVPFFTPTPAQIASAGDDVCVALNQGQSFSQVQSVALDMVGAGSFSWMIPSSDTEVAIQTLVALYCPGNASKVA